jgi:hypothetical protein
MKDAGVLDAALLAQGWDSNVTGDTSLAIEDGRLVVRSSVGATTNEANVSFRHDGKVARITCKTNVEVSSFAGQSRFVWIRLFEPQWEGYYSAYAEWIQGELGASVQGTFADAGAGADLDAATSTIDVFPRVPAPPAGRRLPLVVEYVRSPTSFRVKLGDAENAHSPTSPGNPDVARVIFGGFTPAGPISDAYETRFDDIECVICDDR